MIDLFEPPRVRALPGQTIVHTLEDEPAQAWNNAMRRENSKAARAARNEKLAPLTPEQRAERRKQSVREAQLRRNARLKAERAARRAARNALFTPEQRAERRKAQMRELTARWRKDNRQEKRDE